MDKNNEERKQEIAKTNEKLERTKKSIVHVSVELDKRIDQVENDNRIRATEIRQERKKN